MNWIFKFFRLAEFEEENAKLKRENERLKFELMNKGNLFFSKNQWLGFPRTVHGVIVDGEVISLSEDINGGYLGSVNE